MKSFILLCAAFLAVNCNPQNFGGAIDARDEFVIGRYRNPTTEDPQMKAIEEKMKLKFGDRINRKDSNNMSKVKVIVRKFENDVKVMKSESNFEFPIRRKENFRSQRFRGSPIQRQPTSFPRRSRPISLEFRKQFDEGQKGLDNSESNSRPFGISFLQIDQPSVAPPNGLTPPPTIRARKFKNDSNLINETPIEENKVNENQEVEETSDDIPDENNVTPWIPTIPSIWKEQEEGATRSNLTPDSFNLEDDGGVPGEINIGWPAGLPGLGDDDLNVQGTITIRNNEFDNNVINPSFDNEFNPQDLIWGSQNPIWNARQPIQITDKPNTNVSPNIVIDRDNERVGGTITDITDSSSDLPKIRISTSDIGFNPRNRPSFGLQTTQSPFRPSINEGIRVDGQLVPAPVNPNIVINRNPIFIQPKQQDTRNNINTAFSDFPKIIPSIKEVPNNVPTNNRFSLFPTNSNQFPKFNQKPTTFFKPRDDQRTLPPVATTVSPISFIRYFSEPTPTCSSIDTNNPTGVSFEELRWATETGNSLLIDVRTCKEIQATGTLPWSHNLPVDKIKEAFLLSETSFREQFGFPKPRITDKNIVLSSQKGRRAEQAWRELVSLGFCSARVYFGSFDDWLSKSGPVLPYFPKTDC